jgi:hypothetical protein
MILVVMQDMSFIEVQFMGLFENFLLDIVFVMVVPVAGSVTMLFVVVVVVIIFKNLRVQSFVFVDWLAGDDWMRVLFVVFHLLQGLVANVCRVVLLVVDLLATAVGLSASDTATGEWFLRRLLVGTGLEIVSPLVSFVSL